MVSGLARRADDHTVVVGVDGSPEGTEALRYAIGAALSRGMWLLVVHAYELPPHGPFVATAALAAAAWAAASRVTADALSQVTIPAAVDVETAVQLTTPLLMLQQLSGRVAMIVVGGRGPDPADSGLTPSTSASMAANSSCPTVIVPLGWSQRRSVSRSIVVGLEADTSPGVVLAFAFLEAERRGWAVVALQALRIAAVPADQIGRAADIEAALAAQRRDHPAVPATLAVTVDSLAEVILDKSRGARLLVVGRRDSQSPRLGAWSGSTGREALEGLYCPLAVVPERENSSDGRTD